MTDVDQDRAPSSWRDGKLPPNVRLGQDTVILGGDAFRRFYTKHDPGLVIGDHCTMDGVHFSFQADGRATIGDWCMFANAVLLSEIGLTIGNYVALGWNTTITDCDFHPLEPMERLIDAIACSPLGAEAGWPRPEVPRAPVVIEDDVWVGPGCMIMKGVRIGTGAFIEAGSVVTGDVPPRARLAGNPARVVGEV